MKFWTEYLPDKLLPCREPRVRTLKELIDCGTLTLETVVLGDIETMLTRDKAIVCANAEVYAGTEHWGEATKSDDISIRSTFDPLNSPSQAFFCFGEHPTSEVAEWLNICDCYSTKQAAEAAKEKK